MSAFYVGQRVRIVKACVALEALGKEAVVISGLRRCHRDGFGSWLGHDVSIDGIGATSPRLRSYCFPPEALEPIVPAGLESLDRINELYEPEPEVIRT